METTPEGKALTAGAFVDLQECLDRYRVLTIRQLRTALEDVVIELGVPGRRTPQPVVNARGIAVRTLEMLRR